MNGRKRILVVDDDPDMRKGTARIVAHILSRMGVEYEIFELDNGTQAVDRTFFTDVPFDLVVCDYNMPDMTGIKVVSLLRQYGNKTPIVLVTGREGTEFEEISAEANPLGVLATLQKNTPELMNFLRTHFAEAEPSVL